MKTIKEIIAMFGGVDGLYVSIANEPFMRLVIEHIGEGPQGLPAISVAHYYEMNGDLCQDPEMCFEIESTQQGIVMHPYMFQMANPPIYQEVSNDAQGVALRRGTAPVRGHLGQQPCAIRVLSRPRNGSIRKR